MLYHQARLKVAALWRAGACGEPMGGKGLKRNAISFASNVVVGISSTAPAYSLASSLGVIAGFATFGSPAVLIVAFVPMLFIAIAYHHLNRADADCAHDLQLVTRAMGPHAGWMGGWAIIVTDILVMPSLAAIAGQYTLKLIDIDANEHLVTATLIGTVWIAGMTLSAISESSCRHVRSN